MNKLRSNVKIPEYDFIRALATILVLIGHSVHFGYMPNDISPIGLKFDTHSAWLWEQIRVIIYYFHMPLFVSLSGALFLKTFKIEVSIIRFIGNRAKRLLIPYFLVAVFIWIPTRHFIGWYGTNGNWFEHIWKDAILGLDINYLWYLVMLFEVTVIFMIFSKQLLSNDLRTHAMQLVIFFGFWAISQQFDFLPFQLDRSMEFMVWFYLGAMYERNREHLKEVIKKQYTVYFLITGLVFIALIISNFTLSNILDNYNGSLLTLIKLVTKITTFLIALLGCSFFYVISIGLNPVQNSSNSIRQYICDMSFAIFLYHQPFCQLFRYIISNTKWGVLWLKTELGFTLLVMIQIAIGFIGAIFLNYIVTKIVGLYKQREWSLLFGRRRQ